jgi:26S proteasome regulatory subunit N6
MSTPPTNAQKVDEAKKLSQNSPERAEALYKEVLSQPPGSNDAALKDYENALVGLGELYRDHKRQEDLAELVKASRSAIQSYAKAKTAKLGEYSNRRERNILDLTMA